MAAHLLILMIQTALQRAMEIYLFLFQAVRTAIGACYQTKSGTLLYAGGFINRPPKLVSTTTALSAIMKERNF